jgi:hypothetical protein
MAEIRDLLGATRLPLKISALVAPLAIFLLIRSDCPPSNVYKIPV